MEKNWIEEILNIFIIHLQRIFIKRRIQLFTADYISSLSLNLAWRKFFTSTLLNSSLLSRTAITNWCSLQQLIQHLAHINLTLYSTHFHMYRKIIITKEESLIHFPTIICGLYFQQSFHRLSWTMLYFILLLFKMYL